MCVCVCGVLHNVSYSLLTVHVAIMHNLLLLGVAINEHHIVGLISIGPFTYIIRPVMFSDIILFIHSADI